MEDGAHTFYKFLYAKWPQAILLGGCNENVETFLLIQLMLELIRKTQSFYEGSISS